VLLVESRESTLRVHFLADGVDDLSGASLAPVRECAVVSAGCPEVTFGARSCWLAPSNPSRQRRTELGESTKGLALLGRKSKTSSSISIY
jgi:hypothetical protein